MKFTNYDTTHFYDEMFVQPGRPRPGNELLLEKVESLAPGDLAMRQKAAEKAFYDMGVTFNVYGNELGTEKIIPFDIIPRIIPASEWDYLEKGLKQRIYALNLFIDDIYHDQKIVKDGVVPAELIQSSTGFFPECVGINPPKGVWCHISGSDLVRDEDGTFFVLEDNLRSPSGVSYVMANRRVLKQTFPQVFEESDIRPVENYSTMLLDMFQAVSPRGSAPTKSVLLTPGIYNSAYYEHSFLAMQTGMDLVEGQDLVVHDGWVKVRTTKGLEIVDVIYRRIGEDFLDPSVFRSDSMLGVNGIMDVFRAGRVALANAPGTGVADDKVIYAYVPEVIKYYLNEEPILPNVPTYLCWQPKDLDYVLNNLSTLVVKAASESGGYGMLIGSTSTKEQIDAFAEKIKANPRNYIAQPTIKLSRTPVIVGDHFEGRHVDLRPYILYGDDIQVLPGGLTRVAMVKDTLVVNSSQGGGSKDTWVLS